MIRTYTYTLLSLAFLPLALILLLMGIDAIAPERKRGIWLKLALAVNTSLALVFGFLAGNSKSEAAEPDMDKLLCYAVATTDPTEIGNDFEESVDWQNLETNLCVMENYIRTGNFDSDTADKLYVEMKTSIEILQNDGLISGDDAAILMAYINTRHEYYCTNVGHVRCYEMAAIPPGKETTKKEIAETTATLRQLYEEGKVGDETYNTTLATLEEKLKLYTEKEDNAVLRQLLLDLADGFSGMHFE